jgi:hypothetical protein
MLLVTARARALCRYTAGQQPYDNEPFLVWLLNITALPDVEIPKTISVSYGDNEDTVTMGCVASASRMPHDRVPGGWPPSTRDLD